MTTASSISGASVLHTGLASETASAVRRLLRGDHKAKFIGLAKEYRDRVEAMRSEYSPWVAGKILGLIANLRVVRTCHQEQLRQRLFRGMYLQRFPLTVAARRRPKAATEAYVSHSPMAVFNNIPYFWRSPRETK